MGVDTLTREEAREPREPREAREPREPREPKEGREGREGRDTRDVRDRERSREKQERKSGKNVNIQDLLKVGQEVIVQVAKDPIGTKGARITSHISIPGRHLVFMPTVDHVGISRRIEKDSERRRLREIVDRLRPAGTGFIVRTVAEGVPSEKLEADIKFLIEVWNETVRKSEKIHRAGLMHPDLDLILRATRDLFAQDIELLRKSEQLGKVEKLKSDFIEKMSRDEWGKLENCWHARDFDYIPGYSKCLHFTTIHEQPWMPLPDTYVYMPSPVHDVWHDEEAEADRANEAGERAAVEAQRAAAEADRADREAQARQAAEAELARLRAELSRRRFRIRH